METEIDLEKIGIYKKIRLKDVFSIDIKKDLMFENIFGEILDNNKKIRCKINLDTQKGKINGGYGCIQFGKRINHNGEIKDCAIKKLLVNKPYNILIEVILQHSSYIILEQYNIEYMIPEVYDIYNKVDSETDYSSPQYTINFSMKEIKGIFIDDYLRASKTPERDFIISLMQLCYIFNLLEKHLTLNHRDLRYTNIYIVESSKSIKININKKIYTIISNFHICILDFGFACIGEKNSILNAAGGIIQNEEKCMKSGRDLFQLIISIWCKKSIRNKMKSFFIEEINNLLRTENKDYIKVMSNHLEDSKWPYNITRGDNFSFLPLAPDNLFEKLYEMWYKHSNNI